MPKNKYKVLNKYQDANIQYIIAHEYDGTEESLDWIIAACTILSARNETLYYMYMIEAYQRFIYTL